MFFRLWRLVDLPNFLSFLKILFHFWTNFVDLGKNLQKICRIFEFLEKNLKKNLIVKNCNSSFSLSVYWANVFLGNCLLGRLSPSMEQSGNLCPFLGKCPWANFFGAIVAQSFGKSSLLFVSPSKLLSSLSISQQKKCNF